MNLTESLLLVSVGLVIWVGNRFNWHILPRVLVTEKGALARIPSYVFGVGVILAGVAVWCQADGGDFTWFWRAAALSVAAGLGAVLPRAWDWVAETIARHKDRQDRGHGQAD